jgi:peptidyl-prolyl cis-trans isomerase C
MKTAIKLSLVACFTILAGCEKEATGQVAAVVNGEEITLQEINAELEAMSPPEGVDKNLLQQTALQRIIERRLLAQEARKDGLDQSPEFLIRRRQMEDGLLVQLLSRNAARAADVPDQGKITSFVDSNPALFADRTVYTLDRIQFPMPADMEQLKAFEDDHSMDAVAARLRELGIEFTRGPGRMDSAQLGQERMNEILSLPRTEPFIFPERGLVTAAVITGESKQPISGEQAQAIAVQSMRNRGLMDALQQRLKTARTNAEIKYQEGFAPAGASNADADREPAAQ